MAKFARLVDSLNRPTVHFKTAYVRELTTALVRGIRILLTTNGYHVRTPAEQKSIDHIVDLLSPMGDKDAVEAVKYLTAVYMPIVGLDHQMPERPETLCATSTLFVAEYHRFIARIFANHGRTTRRQISLAMSILQLKRYCPPLPESLRTAAREGLKKRLTTPAVSPEALVDQVVRTVNELFPKGWDRQYPVPSWSVANTSCFEATRGEGGTQAYMFEGLVNAPRFEVPEQHPAPGTPAWLIHVRGLPSHSRATDPWAFLDLATSSAYHEQAKVELVEDPLKARSITKNNWNCAALKPLQKLIHGHLRKHPAFALIGRPIDEEVMAHLDLFPGSKWVSGDYSAATDNFHSDVTEAAIETIASNMTGKLSLRPEYLLLAKRSLTGLNIVDDVVGDYKMVRGQLMGSLLSFPILCMVNFAVWRHSAELSYGNACDGCGKGGRFDKVLINGDDIGFAATPEHYELWKRLVPQVGLSPSLGKNYYSSEFITLNTRVYRYDENVGRLTEVRFLNLGLLVHAKGDTLLAQLESLGKMHDDFVHGAAWKAAASQIFISSWKDLLKKTYRNLFGPREHGGLGATPVQGMKGCGYEGYSVRQLIIARLLEEGKVKLPPQGIAYKYSQFQAAYLERVFPNVKESRFEPESLFPEYRWANVSELVGEAAQSFRSMVSWLSPYYTNERESWSLWNRCKRFAERRKYYLNPMGVEEYLYKPLEYQLWRLVPAAQAWLQDYDQWDEVFA